ncbi:hypothetical protein [Bradyrhizobium sp. CCBAU 11386]|uniref:hypothetical protein n=1 Tax=Bradyrhizobium sp. CCBAU 11386 TaxID=1630837 RepID=UPI0023035DF4|nr:hypothetical protein [Bradyrhizobium sp. CCBAU 11386]
MQTADTSFPATGVHAASARAVSSIETEAQAAAIATQRVATAPIFEAMCAGNDAAIACAGWETKSNQRSTFMLLCNGRQSSWNLLERGSSVLWLICHKADRDIARHRAIDATRNGSDHW